MPAFSNINGNKFGPTHLDTMATHFINAVKELY